MGSVICNYRFDNNMFSQRTDLVQFFSHSARRCSDHLFRLSVFSFILFLHRIDFRFDVLFQTKLQRKCKESYAGYIPHFYFPPSLVIFLFWYKCSVHITCLHYSINYIFSFYSRLLDKDKSFRFPLDIYYDH